MQAYGISDPEQFRFLVENVARLKTMGAPMIETAPLLAGLQAPAIEVKVEQPSGEGKVYAGGIGVS